MNIYEAFNEMCDAVSIMANVIKKQQVIIELHGIELNDPKLNNELKRVNEIVDKSKKLIF